MQALYFRHLQITDMTSKSNLSQASDKGSLLRLTHEYMQQHFENIKHDLGAAGWICEGLIARPAPNRLLESYSTSQPVAD